jgi:hypothetical protein
LLGAGQRSDFAFIDGWHTFDYTLLDFWYLDKMLEVGGVIGFDDCGFPAVLKVIQFLQSHRKYEEIDAGLSVPTSRRLRNAVKRLMGQRTMIKTTWNRYFRKVQQWEPNWDYFADF